MDEVKSEDFASLESLSADWTYKPATTLSLDFHWKHMSTEHAEYARHNPRSQSN